MMTWVLIGVICGSIAYSARLIIEYFDHEREILPMIDRLYEQSDKFLREVEWEAEQKDRLREQTRSLKELVEELQEVSTKAKAELEAENTLLRRLELEVNRRQLKDRKKVAAG